jgi:hypothetical protein
MKRSGSLHWPPQATARLFLLILADPAEVGRHQSMPLNKRLKSGLTEASSYASLQVHGQRRRGLISRVAWGHGLQATEQASARPYSPERGADPQTAPPHRAAPRRRRHRVDGRGDAANALPGAHEPAPRARSTSRRRQARATGGTEEASPYVGGPTLKWLKAKQPQYRAGERGWEPQGKS